MSHLATIHRQTSKISIILNFKNAKELQDQIGENHWAGPTVSLFPQFLDAWNEKRSREIVALVWTFLFGVYLWKQLCLEHLLASVFSVSLHWILIWL